MADLSMVVTASRGRAVSFSFAFNNLDFSDRVLRLDIAPDDADTDSGKKRKAEKYNDWFSSIQSKASKSSDGARLTSLHISSLVLAAQSPFFYKMFNNGMRESQQKNEVCLKINASEEAALMDLLRFMYGESDLNATSFDDLVDLLIVADKFEVTSCMSHCVEMLLKFPMSMEHAIFYLELPSSVLVSEIVKPLTDAAKQFVAAPYKDFTRSQEEAMQLPLCAVEAVLGSKGLQVVSEDDVFDFVLKWARASYPELEERRGILTNHLVRLICFPNMSVTKLEQVLACTDFDNEQVSKLVHKALVSKVELSCGQFLYDPKIKDISTTQCSSAGRVYNPHCVVFFDIGKSDCARLSPSRILESPKFRLGGKLFYLLAHCGHQKDRFGLCVSVMRMENSKSFTLDFELAVMKKSSMEFESKYKVNNHTLEGCCWRLPNLLDITWTELMSEDSDYFINDGLRLKAELTLKI